ncbi:MAG: squalene/phytoene synthase family protein, partial [Candidatus Rokubacteria bacterium]|nr:squalene/phytoene synthase family protein [Candidatus Rokubacteria bacterium]
MGTAPATVLLRDVLPGVSRSFALSLRIVPASLRAPLGITYLIARAADTIADTRALPPTERRRHVEALRAAIGPGATADLGGLPSRVASDHPPAERALLARLPEVLAAYRALLPEDRARCQAVLVTLTQAMLDALAYFPPEGDGRVEALETRADLDRYTYMNAGCVGEFWTDLTAAHRRRCARGDVGRQRARAARFGQGLQLTNVLRDLPRDLRLGRCYLPRADLAALGLAPPDLLDPRALGRLRPLLGALAARARADLDEGLAYVLALPRAEARLRLAALWPLLIGLGTLARIMRAENLLDPAAVVKISRSELRRHIAASVVLAASNGGLAAY